MDKNKKYTLCLKDSTFHIFDYKTIRKVKGKIVSECGNVDYSLCSHLNADELQNKQEFSTDAVDGDVKKYFLSITDNCLNTIESIYNSNLINEYEDFFYSYDDGDLLVNLETLRIFAAHFENWHSSSFTSCGGCIRTLYSS